MRTVCRFVFCAALLAFTAAAAEFKIGSDVSLDSLSIAAGTSNYLIVWRDLSQASPRVMGSLVSTTGVASTEFQISDALAQPLEEPIQHATVAFDGTNFLVVWADNRTIGAGVRGARVKPDGTILGGADFLIAPISRSNDINPLVAYSGADFFVAWQDAAPSVPNGGTEIYFTRVSAAGIPGNVTMVPGISSSSISQSLEFVVAGPNHEALIVFEDSAANPATTRAVRVAADNTFVGSSTGAFLFQRDFSAFGYGATIGAIFADGDYQILSTHSTQIDSTVFKTRILTDGTVIRPSGSFAEVPQGQTDLAENEFPRTFFNGNDQWLFVRNAQVSSTAYHLITKRVKLDGTDLDPNVTLIDSASQGVLNGAMAAAIGSEYLIVWMDGRRSGAQPAKQLNVFGLLADANATTDILKPYLKAVAHVAPFNGSAPLTVGVGNGGSTGIADSVRWDFGDGESSTIGNTVHTYKNKGDYTAVFSIIRAGLYYRDFTRVFVDSDTPGGGGGPPQVIGGSPGPVSSSVNTDVFVTNVTAALNFSTPNSDYLRIFGWFNLSDLAISVKNRTGSITIAGKTYDVKTDEFGTFVSAGGKKPFSRFLVNRINGAFELLVSSEDLASSLAAFGATNTTVPKPGSDVTIPLKIEYAGLVYDSTVTGVYISTAGKSGRLTYLLGNSGHPGDGYFHLFAATATENKLKQHQFVITGNANFGAGAKLEKADTGGWAFSIGNYSETIPVSAIKLSSDVYTYAANKGKTGISQMFYNRRSGYFGVAFKGLAAEGTNPSGMPLATTFFSRADMALSLDLDLAGGANFQASGYVRYVRTKSTSKKWKSR